MCLIFTKMHSHGKGPENKYVAGETRERAQGQHEPSRSCRTYSHNEVAAAPLPPLVLSMHLFKCQPIQAISMWSQDLARQAAHVPDIPEAKDNRHLLSSGQEPASHSSVKFGSQGLSHIKEHTDEAKLISLESPSIEEEGI